MRRGILLVYFPSGAEQKQLSLCILPPGRRAGGQVDGWTGRQVAGADEATIKPSDSALSLLPFTGFVTLGKSIPTLISNF